jgi:hypothetical protein
VQQEENGVQQEGAHVAEKDPDEEWNAALHFCTDNDLW